MTEIEAIEEMSHYSEEEYGKGAVAESHKMAIIALEEIQQYRAFKEIFESHLSAEVVKLLSDKEEFAKWLD
ncbi:MAG: hypothetical protein PUC30_09675, partial [Lachnospiraceae bacterium]|nr:hypothetical protein [Lachnospiraceae bacterium]